MNTIRHDDGDKTRARNNELKKKEAEFDGAKGRQKAALKAGKVSQMSTHKLQTNHEMSRVLIFTIFSLGK